MTPISWIYMLSVWAAITAVTVFCFYRVFTKPADMSGNNDNPAEQDR